MGGNAEISGAFDDLFGDGKAYIGVFGNTGVVVGNRHNRHVVFLDQRQHQFKALFFAGDRVQQRAPFGSGKAVFQRAGDRAVDAQREIDHRCTTSIIWRISVGSTKLLSA